MIGMLCAIFFVTQAVVAVFEHDAKMLRGAPDRRVQRVDLCLVGRRRLLKAKRLTAGVQPQPSSSKKSGPKS
jgi:hypothetical protein